MRPMKIRKSLQEIDEEHIAVTIGNFDGLHVGHQRVLEKVNKACLQEGRTSVVMTFIPHPLAILRAGEHLLINSYRERRELFSKMGGQYLVEIDFTRDFSTLSPREFLDRYVFKNPRVEKIFLGHDFSFGENKRGNHDFVLQYARDKGVEVEVLQEFSVGEIRVSSSVIRQAIQEGQFAEATKMLGRDFFLSGRVIKGAGRGKKIGFATANLDFERDRVIPKKGVYITKAEVEGRLYKAVTNVGRNPTFSEEELINVETHILDFEQDIYGQDLKIYFLERLRDERKFPTVNDLITQINADVLIAKERLK